MASRVMRRLPRPLMILTALLTIAHIAFTVVSMQMFSLATFGATVVSAALGFFAYGVTKS